jgi:hypothetical protein
MSDSKKYRCELCGTESDQADECCGQPMIEVSGDGCGCECDDCDDDDENED